MTLDPDLKRKSVSKDILSFRKKRLSVILGKYTANLKRLRSSNFLFVR